MTDVTTESPQVDTCTMRACLIATGETPAASDAPAFRIKGASKDYSARGSRRHHWFRMVLRNGEWVYVSRDRLPSGNFLASDRHAAVYGDAYEGEVTITHDFGGGVDDDAHLVIVQDDGKQSFVACPVKRTRDGLRITLPNGSVISASNPRSR